MEHFRAILILCESRVANGSAFTLLRPLVEAVVRGEWILRCATDPKFVGICNGTARFPKFQVMAVALDEHHVSCDYASGPYFAAFTEAFSALSGYTHTGVEQMAHRFQNDGAIGPTYPEKTITGLMNEAEKIVVRHFALFAQIRGFNDVATALLAPYDAASDS